MTSVKLKLRMPSDCRQEGTLYYQVTHKRTVRQISTGCRIRPCEWDTESSRVNEEAATGDRRRTELERIRRKTENELHNLHAIASQFEAAGRPYSARDIVSRYLETAESGMTVFAFIRRQAARLRLMGRCRTADTYKEALSSLMRFRSGDDIHFCALDTDMMERYEAWMRSHRLCRNTTSFYMRVLRTVYNQAVAEGIAPEATPFRNVYTGIDKTPKRAITLKEIRLLKELNLTGSRTLEFARDIFLLSFYLRGMSFVDLAFLRKTDLSNGFVTYSRRKTGQQLIIRWESQMQQIIDRHPNTTNGYMLPIIMREDGTEERQYRNRMLIVNRRLKTVAEMAGLHIPLTLYVARHSWASIAKAKNIPLSIICGAMGHDSERTTQIYLAAIQTDTIDDANRNILREL